MLKIVLFLMSCALALCFACLSFPGLAAPSAPAGNYLGNALLNGRSVSRWNDSTRILRINIETPTRLQGWTPRKIDLVKSAFAEWEQAMGGRFHFVYTNFFYDSDILVKWQQRSSGELIGLTTYQWDNTNTLTDTNINISLINPDGRYQTDSELRSTALHEIGHALGIKGHSPNPSDIMYPYIHANITRLTARDIATMKALYQLKPDITNPVGISFERYQRFIYFAGLGYKAHQQGQERTALQNYMKAEEYYPQDPRVPYLVGVSAYNMQNYPLALQNFSKAAGIQGKYQVESEYYLACALFQMGAQDMRSGNTTSGKQRLFLARQHYMNTRKSLGSSPEMRQDASRNIDLINQYTAN